MRSVMASAMRPSSTVKVSVFEMLSGDRNAGLIAAKTAISRIKSTKGPNSGADMMRRSVDVCAKSDHRRKGGEGDRRRPEWSLRKRFPSRRVLARDGQRVRRLLA